METSDFKEPHWLDKASSILEQNILGVKLGIYGVGLIGLGIALRSVRPFKKIVSPSDIPEFFITSNVKLRGKVVGVQLIPKPGLAIDHEPLLGASIRKQGHLPVTLEGINITGNGMSWMQSIVIGKNVDFIILEQHQDFLSVIVYDNKRNIANHLVSIGFASVAPFNSSLENHEIYKNYYKNLLQSENKAEKMRNGIWWDRSSSKFSSLIEFIMSKVPVLKVKTIVRR